MADDAPGPALAMRLAMALFCLVFSTCVSACALGAAARKEGAGQARTSLVLQSDGKILPITKRDAVTVGTAADGKPFCVIDLAEQGVSTASFQSYSCPFVDRDGYRCIERVIVVDVLSGRSAVVDGCVPIAYPPYDRGDSPLPD